jgi:hypothetical protein
MVEKKPVPLFSTLQNMIKDMGNALAARNTSPL